VLDLEHALGIGGRSRLLYDNRVNIDMFILLGDIFDLARASYARDRAAGAGGFVESHYNPIGKGNTQKREEAIGRLYADKIRPPDHVLASRTDLGKKGALSFCHTHRFGTWSSIHPTSFNDVG